MIPTLWGEHGVQILNQLIVELQKQEVVLNNLQREREWLEHHVSLLSPPYVDQDMLEESALNILRFTTLKHFIILLPKDR